MVYCDTSFVTPLILQEATSAQVERFLIRVPAGEPSISLWTKVEFAALLARRVRMKLLDSRAAAKAEAQFEAVTSASFAILQPEAGDFDVARQFVGHYETGLRGADALHLAIAANNKAATIYTLDKALLGAGKRLGLPMSTGIRSPGLAN